MSHIIYNILKTVAKSLGFNIIVTRIHSKVSFADHEPIWTSATYAPWLTDQQFNETYAVIADYTLIDAYRCYELWQIVGESAKLKGALIEIGVWRGGSGALIAKKALIAGIHDNVYLCDTFTGVVKAGERDSRYKGGEHADTSEMIVQEVIGRLGLNNTKILVGTFPEETGTLVEDETFRFCHIDVDVYQSAKDILQWVWPRLVIGGVVVFDDYGFKGCDGVTRLVNEEKEKSDRIAIYNLNGHAVLIKISEEHSFAVSGGENTTTRH